MELDYMIFEDIECFNRYIEEQLVRGKAITPITITRFNQDDGYVSNLTIFFTINTLPQTINP